MRYYCLPFSAFKLLLSAFLHFNHYGLPFSAFQLLLSALDWLADCCLPWTGWRIIVCLALVGGLLSALDWLAAGPAPASFLWLPAFQLLLSAFLCLSITVLLSASLRLSNYYCLPWTDWQLALLAHASFLWLPAFLCLEL
jgi:hypothetical protein